ncbi:hypothetical protein DLH72_04855 [Candidatus Gracilibacteria bacterium]|nr:MAG: hypothetical protein DLH72_04855 [Candidatus Gracilibacteria bacterium]
MLTFFGSLATIHAIKQKNKKKNSNKKKKRKYEDLYDDEVDQDALYNEKDISIGKILDTDDEVFINHYGSAKKKNVKSNTEEDFCEPQVDYFDLSLSEVDKLLEKKLPYGYNTDIIDNLTHLEKIELLENPSRYYELEEEYDDAIEEEELNEINDAITGGICTEIFYKLMQREGYVD